MNKTLKTMFAVAALTLSANAEKVTQNETALWNEVQRTFLTWNGQNAFSYACKEEITFSDWIGYCRAQKLLDNEWGADFRLLYDLGEDATDDDFDAVYQKVVSKLKSYGKTFIASEEAPSRHYSFSLADGRSFSIGVCYRYNHRYFTIGIYVPRQGRETGGPFLHFSYVNRSRLCAMI